MTGLNEQTNLPAVKTVAEVHYHAVNKFFIEQNAILSDLNVSIN
jgi:hypothetical protein